MQNFSSPCCHLTTILIPFTNHTKKLIFHRVIWFRLVLLYTRYVDEPGGNSGNSKSAKKNSARGNRIPGIFPKSIRRRWAKDELQAIKSAAVDAAVASPPAERRLSPSCSLHEADREAGARSGGIDGGWDATAIMYPSASL